MRAKLGDFISGKKKFSPVTQEPEVCKLWIYMSVQSSIHHYLARYSVNKDSTMHDIISIKGHSLKSVGKGGACSPLTHNIQGW